MEPGTTIFVCFIVITPVCAWVAWKVFTGYMLDKAVEQKEVGNARLATGAAPAVAD